MDYRSSGQAHQGYELHSYTEASIPQVGENEVLVKFQPASLSYLDVAIAKVNYQSQETDSKFTILNLG
jgi:NADPH:quinone reductase-like Zn-dependent oxidoreductase